MIYLDNAATSGKKPQSVINSVNDCMYRFNANPGRSGHNLSIAAALKVYETRKELADFFGADGAENVVFTMNCTESLNFVIKGVLKKGDHIIISDLEHNAVMRPLYKTGLNFDVASVCLDNDEETVGNFCRLINKNTKMIICTAASNVCGKILPLKKIGDLCADRGIFFTVDAAQGAGILPINMKEMNIDFLCIAPHKGLYAPMGTGVLIATRKIENTIIEGGTGSDSLNLKQPEIMPEMLESGTTNLPGIFGISAGLNFLKKKKISQIYQHEIQLIQTLYKRLKHMENIVLYTPYPAFESFAPVLSFNMLGVPSDECSAHLNKYGIFTRAGLHCAPLAHKKLGTAQNGTVRVSPGYFNNKNEIVSLIECIRNFKKVTNHYN